MNFAPRSTCAAATCASAPARSLMMLSAAALASLICQLKLWLWQPNRVDMAGSIVKLDPSRSRTQREEAMRGEDGGVERFVARVEAREAFIQAQPPSEQVRLRELDELNRQNSPGFFVIFIGAALTLCVWVGIFWMGALFLHLVGAI
jgi:hypothetical protein